MTFKVLGGRFNFGIDIDDMWRYAGLPEPYSTVIPFLLNKRTFNGRFNLPFGNGKAPEKFESKEFRDFNKSIIADQNRHDTKQLARTLALFLKRNKIDYIRCLMPWNFFEPKLGRGYQFPLDNFVNEMNEEGIGIIAVIGHGYRRFLPNLRTDNIKTYVENLARSSTEIVRHYKGKINVWQIENEPNWWGSHAIVDWRSGSIWFDDNSQEPILRALHDVVRNESPKSTIVINLESHQQKINWNRYSKYCDIIGVDAYPSYLRSDQTDASIIQKISKEAADATSLPVYVMETGYPSGPRLLGFTERRQAKFVASASKNAFTGDDIKGLSIFRFADSYWKSFPYHENHFGLLSVKGNPKPAWHEYVRQIKELK